MRKLATVAFSFCAAVFLSLYLIPTTGQFAVAAACALLAALALVLPRRFRLRAVLVLMGLFAGFCYCGLYCHFHLERVTALDGQTLSARAVALGRAEETDYGGRVLAVLDAPGAPKAKIRLYLYDSDFAIEPGDELSFTARFRAADTLYGEETDVFFSKGIFLTASPEGDVIVTGSSRSVAYLPARLAAAVSDKIKALFPRDAAVFLRALLIGETRELYADKALSEALRLTGTAHIVSVSGMHVAFLMNTLALVVRRKRYLPVAGFPVLLLFMGMAGFQPAVVRAGVMQAFLMLAPLVKRQNDPPTALSAALMVILLNNPYSARSVSLHLSFSATAGLLLFSERLLELFERPFASVRSEKVKRALRGLLAAPASSIAALSLSLPLTALHFGTISLISPLANLAVLWAVSLSFTLGVLTLLIGFITAPAGALAFLPGALAFVTALPCRFVLWAVKILARVPLAAVYTSSALVAAWLVYLYLLALLLFLMRKNKARPVIPACLAGASLCIVLLVTSAFGGAASLTVTALDVGQGACTVFESGGMVCVVDCGSSSGVDAGDVLARYLMSRGRSRVDLLVLTHYHDDHINGLETAFARVPVAAVALPEPLEEDMEAYARVASLAFDAKADIIEISQNVSARLGDAALSLFAPVGGGSTNERCLAVLCSFRAFDALVTGDMNTESEIKLLYRGAFPDIELLIVGHHGSKYSTSDFLLQTLDPEVAIISVGYNSYGHPAPELLERLGREGVAVYRTDEAGHITITAS
jgi:competence protein ComEC